MNLLKLLKSQQYNLALFDAYKYVAENYVISFKYHRIILVKFYTINDKIFMHFLRSFLNDIANTTTENNRRKEHCCLTAELVSLVIFVSNSINRDYGASDK